ncbi:MAG TPA: hypothetical protein PLR99_07005 [Polyangiaceae bacterium]|jgi:type IV secretory pathway VirB10-like protein|nr:hypothetical protein [Polyangiaceae bacterium]
MKTKSLLRGLPLAAAILAHSALAFATPPSAAAPSLAFTSTSTAATKPSAPPRPEPTPAAATARPATAPPAEATAARAAPDAPRKTRLTPQEQLVEAQRRLDRMRGSATLVRKRLQRARHDRDLVVSTCLTEKLTQLNVTARAADARASALRDALARQDAATADREFTALGKLAEHAEDVDLEAKQCTSIELALSDTTAVKVTLDPRLAPATPSFPAPATSP